MDKTGISCTIVCNSLTMLIVYTILNSTRLLSCATCDCHFLYIKIILLIA